MATVLHALAFTLLFVVSVYLVFHDEYDDGLFGRFFLGIIALVSAVMLLQIREGVEFEFMATTELLIFAFAGFLIRHTWRFKRALKRLPPCPLSSGCERYHNIITLTLSKRQPISKHPGTLSLLHPDRRDGLATPSKERKNASYT